ncbi:MAG TPA: hypothetical protein VLH08_18545 [Acidobacteriota bacterium]|jgi:hypothetical protein|nr:hypothetical protein [Acidobacteriota bacterium]
MQESEKNLLEKLADAIPGLKGYREKESRRDTDKRFRDYLADRIDRSRGNLDETKRTLVNQGKLDGLAELDRLSQKMMKLSNQIRHATYGYSGFFDQVKIGENELDQIYQHDLSILSDVEALETSLKNPQAASEWESRIQAIDDKLDERKHLFSPKS